MRAVKESKSHNAGKMPMEQKLLHVQARMQLPTKTHQPKLPRSPLKTRAPDVQLAAEQAVHTEAGKDLAHAAAAAGRRICRRRLRGGRLGIGEGHSRLRQRCVSCTPKTCVCVCVIYRSFQSDSQYFCILSKRVLRKSPQENKWHVWDSAHADRGIARDS